MKLEINVNRFEGWETQWKKEIEIVEKFHTHEKIKKITRKELLSLIANKDEITEEYLFLLRNIEKIREINLLFINCSAQRKVSVLIVNSIGIKNHVTFVPTDDFCSDFEAL